MDTWGTIRARRNVRQYTGQPIAYEDHERILEAGRRAPSAGNWQPWNFVVVTDREQLIELAKVWEHGGRHIAQSAATIALVAREPVDEAHRDWLPWTRNTGTRGAAAATPCTPWPGPTAPTPPHTPAGARPASGPRPHRH